MPTHSARRISLPYLAATVAYLGFLVTIVVLANTERAAWVFTASTLVASGDYICHMLLMGLFSFFLNSALLCRTTTLLGVHVQIGGLVVYMLVAAEELSQLWVPSRNADILDLVFDIAGIYLFGRLAKVNLGMKHWVPEP